jgi:transcription elongation factor Elf1
MNFFLNGREMRVGQCGACDLKVRFWAQDGARLMCVNCGLAHEVEVDAALDLTTGKRTKVVMLVAVRKERSWEHDTRAN